MPQHPLKINNPPRPILVVKMGRGLYVMRCSDVLTPHSTKQVLQALVLSYLDYCPVIWSSAAKKDLVNLLILA